METLTIIYVIAWLCLALVSILVGKEKGIDVALLVVPSLVAAPFVYLYVLAVPPSKEGKSQ